MKPESGFAGRFLIAAGLFAMLGILGPSSALAEKKISVKESELPAALKQAIDGAFPGGEILAIEKEVEGEDPGQYDVELRSGGKEYEIELSPEGEIKESKERAPRKSSETALPAGGPGKKWTEAFYERDYSFSSQGRNRFFILEPGCQLTLESENAKVVITVLDDTRDIAGVKTGVVEEREWEDGELKEVSRNFFALCKETGDVFYFGEEVDDYKGGKIVGSSGSWRADEEGSRAGIIMPGRALLGARHYQEIAPNAKDRAEIVADDVSMKTPAGEFENCLRVEETSGLNPREKCYKTYAPGVGLIQDEDLLLTHYGKAKPGKSSATRGEDSKGR